MDCSFWITSSRVDDRSSLQVLWRELMRHDRPLFRLRFCSRRLTATRRLRLPAPGFDPLVPPVGSERLARVGRTDAPASNSFLSVASSGPSEQILPDG